MLNYSKISWKSKTIQYLCPLRFGEPAGAGLSPIIESIDVKALIKCTFQFLVFASKNDFSPSYNKDIFLYFLKL